MSFRFGFIVGGGVGYYLGAKAGRQRYDQLNRALRKLRSSDAFETATDKAKATLEGGVVKARGLVESKLGNGHGHGSNGPSNGTPPSRFS